MTDELKERWEKKCRWWLGQIEKNIRLQVPDCIQAHAIVSLLDVAMAYLGESVTVELGRRMVSDARRSHGFCQTCDNPIPNHKSFHAHCGECEAKFAGEAFKIEMELQDEE